MTLNTVNVDLLVVTCTVPDAKTSKSLDAKNCLNKKLPQNYNHIQEIIPAVKS